jgi:hypothetical protein
VQVESCGIPRFAKSAKDPDFTQTLKPVPFEWTTRLSEGEIDYNQTLSLLANKMLRFSTAGESHGECLIALISGLPAGLDVDVEFIDRELWRRQQGYGRGGRMRIEQDRAHILSGVRHGKTIGSPVAIQVENRDWKNWTEVLPVAAGDPAKQSTKLWLRRGLATPTLPARSSTIFPTHATCWSGPRRASRRRVWRQARWPSCS